MVESPLSSTIYTCLGTNTLSSCIGSATSMIIVLPSATYTITGDTLLCAGESTTLTALGDDLFQWVQPGYGNPMPISPTVTATYTLYLTNLVNGCKTQTYVAVTVQQCVNTIGHSFELSPKIYPNPAHDHFIYSTQHFPEKINITDVAGKTVFETDIISQIQVINIEQLSDGIYFIHTEKDPSGILLIKSD
jgi:hypothetical protein